MIQGSQFILLHPDDNVFVCREFCSSGTAVQLDGDVVVLQESISIGHKIARVGLPRNATIYKHGAPIGSTTTRIERGAHVHLDNLKSDYIRTHGRNSSFDKDSS